VLSFATADVLDAQQAASAQPKESGRQASTNKGVAPSAQSAAQGTRPNKKTDQHLPLKQPLEASTAANAGSKSVLGQGSQAGSLAQPNSPATQAKIAKSQTAHMAGSDAAAVSAGQVSPRLPAQIHTSAANEESSADACSMLLVAGSHLRRWLSIVKLVSTTSLGHMCSCIGGALHVFSASAHDLYFLTGICMMHAALPLVYFPPASTLNVSALLSLLPNQGDSSCLAARAV